MNVRQYVSNAQRTVRNVTGVCVKYQRGANWVTLKAGTGATAFQSTQGDGTVIDFRSRDYLIGVCDLVLNGVKVTPQKGDTITEEAGGRSYTYIVIAPNGDQAYRFSDEGRSQFRVHTEERAGV